MPRKPELIKATKKKVPINPIISFLQVNFNCHITFLPFHGSHRVNDLLSNNNVICTMSARDKAALVRRYNT